MIGIAGRQQKPRLASRYSMAWIMRDTKHEIMDTVCFATEDLVADIISVQRIGETSIKYIIWTAIKND